VRGAEKEVFYDFRITLQILEFISFNLVSHEKLFKKEIVYATCNVTLITVAPQSDETCACKTDRLMYEPVCASYEKKVGGQDLFVH
jgi:hypothetical protein